MERVKLAHLEAEEFRRGVGMTKGVLMLFAGEQVLGEPGTWAAFFAPSGMWGAVTPTYGSRDDVQRWLRDDYAIEESMDLRELHDQLGKVHPKNIGFYLEATQK
jgi:hypothetical protein